MKKINFLLMLGLMSAASMQAQTTIVSLGFEPGDVKGQSSAYSLTPGLSEFGDWVNVKDVDLWDEKSQDEVHSGEYALYADNYECDPAAQSWDRGFKIAKLPIKDNSAYRVSFWIKGTYGSKLSSWLAKGIENYDKSICTATGQNYGLDQVTLNGDWQHMSFVSYYANADVMNNYIANSESWRGGADFPEEFGGNGEQTYSEFFEGKLPEEFFFIANMFTSNSEYILDDIKIEEGVTFNQATFNGEYFAIKLDFGYSTNIAALANENEGSFSLDPSCVTVKINGTDAAVDYVEGKSDGFLYIFVSEDVVMNEDDEIIVSFTPAADCPILYDGDKRPSADAETEMQVLGFTNEVAYFDGSIDALPSAFNPAKMVSSVPENESFEIDKSTLQYIYVTYDKKVQVGSASATLQWKDNFGEKSLDLSNGMFVSDDGLTVVTPIYGASLEDGEYTFILSNVENEMGFPCQEDQQIIFAVGEDHDTSVSEVIYASDFDNDLTEGVPPGWVTYNEAGFHIYGFNDDGSQYTYHYGGNPGGGGTRLFDGFSGDFNKAMYWGSRGTNEGYAEYGSQVKDYLLPGGEIDPDMPEDIALKLEPRKYQVTFKMAAWKGEPVFRFTLEDLEGNVYARFNDYVATPNMNGNKGKVSGTLTCTTDFTVDKAGYYVLRFAAQDAQWQEFLLANVKVITMPSKAAYWKQQLAAAVEEAEPIMDLAYDALYNGDTKTAFAAAINNAKTGHFTSPSEITALINQLKELGTQMQTRIDNIDTFVNSISTAADAVAALEGKYAESPYAKDAQVLVDKYAGTDPTSLSDAELAEVAPKLANASALMANVPQVVDILTWRAYKAAQTAEKLGVEGAEKDAAYNVVDDDDAVVEACNQASKLALYQWFAQNAQAPGVNPEIDETMKTEVHFENSQKANFDGEYIDMTGDEIAASGIDFTCLVKNPHFYTFTTNGAANLQDNTVVGWNCEQYEGGSVHLANNASATEANPVITSAINAYAGGAEYKFYQVIENAPVGVYNVYFATRTAIKNQLDPDTGIAGVFNAMDDETGIWDKYIFAQVDDDEPIMVPFSAGSSWFGHLTVIPNVEVKEGSKLTIGAVEHYISGKASGHDYNATSSWDTNTFVGESRMYMVAPLQGYDYGKAAEDLANAIELVNAEAGRKIVGIFSVSGTQVPSLQKGLNIVKFDNGNVRKVYIK